MTRAQAIVMAAAGDYNRAYEAAEAIAVSKDQYWASETTVYTLPDDSRIALSGTDFWAVSGPKHELLVELMEARECGTEQVWYGNVENASPFAIDEAITDIMRMDENAIGDGSWGEWDDPADAYSRYMARLRKFPADKCPLPGYECDHDGGCDTCPHKS